jgi:hypothetical protein
MLAGKYDTGHPVRIGAAAPTRVGHPDVEG